MQLLPLSAGPNSYSAAGLHFRSFSLVDTLGEAFLYNQIKLQTDFSFSQPHSSTFKLFQFLLSLLPSLNILYV